MFTNKLFRFRSVNQFSILELNNRTLWFSDVNDFNDPFEFRFNVCTTPPKSRQHQYDYLSLTIDNYNENHKLTKNEFIEAIQKYNKTLTELSSSELEERVIEDINRSVELHVNHLIEHKSTKVCCLSEQCDDPLMWAHYTDGMTGFAIVYNEFSTLENKVIPALHVNYVDKIPVVDYKLLDMKSNEDGKRLNTAVLASKHRRWEYEKEVRFFACVDHKYDIMNNVKLRSGGIMDLPDNAIHGVIVGHKMTKDNFRLINDICGANNYKVYQAEPSKDQYSVDIFPID